MHSVLSTPAETQSPRSDAAGDDDGDVTNSHISDDCTEAHAADAPESGGWPTAAVVVLIACTVSVLVFIVGIAPMGASSRKTADRAIQREQQLVADAVSQRTRNFFRGAYRVPTGLPPALLAPNFDMFNETQALSLLATVMRMCLPDCFTAYYGIDTPDNLHYTLFKHSDGGFRFERRGPPPSFRSEVAVVTGIERPLPSLSAFSEITTVLVPRERPWWPILYNRSGWVPIYRDIRTNGTSTTTGGPVVDSNGTVRAVFAVDIVFSTLFADLQSGSANTRRAVLYEAFTHRVLYSTRGQHSAHSIVTLNQTTDGTIADALSKLSREDLDSATVVTKRLEAGLVDDAVRVQPVAEATGLNLRFLLVVSASDESRAIVTTLIGSVVGGVVATLLVVGAAVAFAIVVVERPLSRMASQVSHDSVAALRGEDGESEAVADADALPALREMRVIQAAFDDLLQELRRVRAFIPDGAFLDAATFSASTSVRGDGFIGGAVNVNERARDDADGASVPSQRDVDLSSISSSLSRGVTPTSGARPHDADDLAASRPNEVRSRAWAVLRMARPASLTDHFLTAATVSYLDVQVRDFYRALETLPNLARTAVTVCDLIAGIFQKAAATFNGAVAQFVGDRAALSFNASKANTSHKRSAVECALAVSKMIKLIRVDLVTGDVGFERSQGLPIALPQGSATNPLAATSSQRTVAPCGRGVASGVASGRALVGNIGSTGLTRFCVISDAVHGAAKWASLCLANDGAAEEPALQCLASGTIAQEISHTVAFQFVDAKGHQDGGVTPQGTTSWPGGSHLVLAPMRMLTDAPRAASDPGDGEWMYELQRAQASNEFSDINRAFESFVAHDVATARIHLDKALARDDAAKAAIGVSRLQVLLGRPAPSPIPT